METVLHDLRYALRTMRKQFGLTAAIVLTLALGIGANGAIFALVDTVLLRELPLPDSERLMMISERTEASEQARVSPVNMMDWRQRSQSFEAIGGYSPGVGSMVMSGSNGAETIPRQWVTEGVFGALGINAIAGRTFIAEDDLQERNVVVLAESFWRTRFNSDPDIVGQNIRLDGETFTVVGVVPQGAEIIGRASIWAMAPTRNLPADARGAYWLNAVARLKLGVSLDTARNEMTSIAANLAREYPATNEGRGVAIAPLRDAVLGSELRRTSLLFLGVAGFILLICFANIANLLLTRTAARSNELAIRSVLGADRGRLLRQFWTENFVLSFFGGVVGLLVAGALLRAAPSVMPAALLPAGIALDFDVRIVVFCAIAAVAVGLLFSLASASQVAGFANAGRLAPAGSRTVTDRSSRKRELLVAGQIATAAVLLYCAGLLSRSLVEVGDVDPGYHADSVLSMLIDPLSDSYPTPELLLQFYDDVESEVESQAGVADAAWTTALPFGPSMIPPRVFEVTGASVPAAQRPATELQAVSGDFFRTLDLPLLAGRTFDARDARNSVLVCIVNEAFAHLHLGGRATIGQNAIGQNVIGERISRWRQNAVDAEPAVCEVVGVVGNTRRKPDEVEQPAQMYVPFTQFPDDDVYLVVRPASGDANALVPSVRSAIAVVDRAQLVSVRDVVTLEEIARDATANYRFRAVLVVAFAALALLLAMIGLFGVLAHSVQKRWREYGVRMALGASSGDVTRHIGMGVARLVVPGTAAGTGLAMGVGQLLGAMLFGIQPFDAITLTVVFILLLVTAAAASAGPAFRATRLDPAVALRNE